jgi:hypothetical protein
LKERPVTQPLILTRDFLVSSLLCFEMGQLVTATLRPDNNLIAFRRTLEENGESLVKWRQNLPSRVTSKGEDAEGFEVLDANDRAGWELCKSLVGLYKMNAVDP